LKRVGNLFEQIISDENLNRAIDEVNRSHHWRPRHKPNKCTAWVEETKPERVKELKKIIERGFNQKPPKVKERYDVSARKTRIISEPIQWPDQYVHHALIQVLQPVMMRGMDHYCCGSIQGRGAHFAAKSIKHWLKDDPKGTRWELCADVYHFYDTLQPDVVMDRMRHLIKDHRTLDLVWRVIKDGVKIGAYPSQWFANTTLQPLDVLIRQSGLCNHYARYMDNLTILGSNKRKLHKHKKIIETWLEEHRLQLKGDWQIFPVCYGKSERMPDAVGYRYGRGYSIPRKHNFLRMKRALARYRKKREAGKITPKMAHSILSRLGQLRHCNNCNIYKKLYRGERIERELKAILKRNEEALTWSMFLAQRQKAAEKLKSSKPSEQNTRITTATS
jgi:hypothetical protein